MRVSAWTAAGERSAGDGSAARAARGWTGARCGPGRLRRDERGTTAIEYALLGSMVAVGCIAALYAFADSRDGLWTRVAGLLVAAMGGP